jgi:hypothetical protein
LGSAIEGRQRHPVTLVGSPMIIAGTMRGNRPGGGVRISRPDAWVVHVACTTEMMCRLLAAWGLTLD